MEHANLAAVDLGSNSFHLVVGRVTDDGIAWVDRRKERVRLAGGLDAEGNLTEEAQRRALDCLTRFGERLAAVPRGRVRAVGTSTLRKAQNALPFLVRAHEVLGHRIDIITGRQEAQLIYRGVSRELGRVQGRRLVVDIGGGSTEIVLGRRGVPTRAASLDMGCVSFTRRYFGDGRLTHAAFEAATDAARQRLRARAPRGLDGLEFQDCRGSSGTIRAVGKVLRKQGWTDGRVTLDGMARMRAALIDQGRIDALDLEGLSETRRPVIAGGLAVLTAVFEELELPAMDPCKAALREGVLYGLWDELQDARDDAASLAIHAA